jgi:hypothetical protein
VQAGALLLSDVQRMLCFRFTSKPGFSFVKTEDNKVRIQSTQKVATAPTVCYQKQLIIIFRFGFSGYSRRDGRNFPIVAKLLQLWR